MNERAVAAGDREFLLRVFAESRRGEFARLGWDGAQMAQLVEMQFDIQQRAYALQFPSAEHSILSREGEPAGQWRVARGERSIVLVDIAVIERLRGRGIGSACIAKLCREATERAVEVCLSVRPDNRAYRLYRRFGFEETSRDAIRVSLAWRPARSRSALAEPCRV